ncbi:lymphocyte antigen-6, epidermis [Trichomycterus rosablanca]|uniref:lymphocyte antigen-6, epidermis n=1 Tax=Trichomycterus rosablanca TaxID=2290929 RepID=UPI002F350DA6
MKAVLFGLIALVGVFALTESLTCNSCSLGMFGICMNPSSTQCNTSTSLCTTTSVRFTGISGFFGFTSQSCIDSSNCNVTVTSSILTAQYTISQRCCSTSMCNPTNAAPYTQLSAGAALSAALLACLWSQSVY